MDEIKKLASMMAGKKGYYDGGMVSMADIREQELAKKEAEEAILAQKLQNEEGIKQAAAEQALLNRGRNTASNSLTDSMSSSQAGVESGPQKEELFKAMAMSMGKPAPQPLDQLSPGPETNIFSRTSDALARKQLDGSVGVSPEVANRKLAGEKLPSPKAIPSDSLSMSQAAPMDPYGKDLNDAALAKAQGDSKFLRMLGGLANAGSTISSGLSKGAAQDLKAGQGLIDNADTDKKNILERREGKDKEVARQKNLIDLATEQDKANAGSDVSRIGQAIVKALAQKTGIPIKNVENASWASLEKVVPGLERYAGMIESSALRRESKQDALNEKAKLSDKQTADITSFDKAIDALDNVLVQKKNFNTGKASFALNKVGSFVGMDDAQKSAFKSDVGEQLAAYIKSISGATVSPTERAALLENVPSVYDDDDTFEAKGKALRARLQRSRDLEVAGIKKQGKNTKNFESDAKVTTPNEDPRVEAFMKANNIKDKNEAIKILKEAGKL